MDVCMSFGRNGAENMKEVKSGKSKLESENWKVKIGKWKCKVESGNEHFFFLSCFVKCVCTYLGMIDTVLTSGRRARRYR